MGTQTTFRRARGLSVEALEDRVLLSFAPAASFPTGPYPDSVAVADFNRDGKPDAVTTNNQGNSVSLLLGNGDGTFQAPRNYATGPSPISVAAGDFDGDGNPDIAVANWDGNSVSVLPGNGDGTFRPAVNYAVGANPHNVVVADLNGDGKPDLVVTNYSGSSISVLLGNGGGTFRPAVNYTTGPGPHSVAVADFNHDHKPDLVVVDNLNDTVSVLFGNGDGSFQAPVYYPEGPQPVSVAVGDFNGDGNLDLAVSNHNYSGGSSLGIMLGNRDGTFQPAVKYGLNALGSRVVVASDFNGDGKVDLAVTGYFTNNVNVLRGNGDGTFQPPVTYGVGTGPDEMVAADLNGDGAPDLALVNTRSNQLSVLLNQDGAAVMRLGVSVPAGTTAGNLFAVTVSALNRFNAAVTGFRGTVHFSSSDPQAVLPGDYTFTAADNGTHAFTVTLKTAGAQSVTVTGTITGLLVGDYSTGQIQKYDPQTGAFLGTFAAAGGLAGPVTLASGPDGNLYVAGEISADVVRFNGTTGQLIDTFVPAGDGGLASAHGLAFGPDGNLYVSSQASSNRDVRRFSGATGAFIDIFVPAGSGGVSPPLGMKFGPDGNLYVASRDTNQVLRYNGATSAFMGVFASGNGLDGPVSLTFGPDGNLYVSSWYSNQVFRFDGQTGQFLGVFASGGGLLHPNELAFGPDGNLYVAAEGSGVERFNGKTGAFLDNFVPVGSGGLVRAVGILFSSASIAGTPQVIFVNPAAASTLLVAGYPSPTVTNAAHDFTVTAEDPYGNIATGYRGTVHFSTPDRSNSLPADYTFTAADDGVHTFSATFRRPGTWSLTATDTVNPGISGTQAGIVVVPPGNGNSPTGDGSSAPAAVPPGMFNQVNILLLPGDAPNSSPSDGPGDFRLISGPLTEAVHRGNWPRDWVLAYPNGEDNRLATAKEEQGPWDGWQGLGLEEGDLIPLLLR